jgi:hypothetical protein
LPEQKQEKEGRAEHCRQNADRDLGRTKEKAREKIG